jgi:dephospho-CoA kinase
MLHVGLTGGLASGKSVVGRELERLGCLVIRMDELGHQVLAPDGEAYDPVIEAFGRDILKPSGEIDRRELAHRVFNDSEQLAKLNALVHPPVFARAKAIAEASAREHPERIVVTEAAIMIETGSYKNYDRLIVAACSPEQQLERALSREKTRDKLTREEVLSRIRNQMPIDEKKRHAHFVIDTSGSLEQTLHQTRQLFEELRSLKK